MEDDVIEIFDSNVEEISDVTIVEERIADGSEIFFNDQQIKSHLTGLLYTDATQLKSLPKRVDLYFQLLRAATQEHVPVNDALKPVISAMQYTHYVEKDDHLPDPGFEEARMIKPSQFERFLEQFHKLNRDVSNTYTSASKRLYALFRPFESVSVDTVIANGDADVIDTMDRHYRALGPGHGSYEGDNLSIAGFFAGDPSEKGKRTVQFDDYIERRAAMRAGDTVKVVFNDFALESNKSICYETDGKIEEGGSIKLLHPLLFKGVVVQALGKEDRDNDYFVFDSKTEDTFSKRRVQKGGTIVLSKTLRHYDLRKALTPSTPSQALFIDHENVHSIQDVEAVLVKYGYTPFSLPEHARSTIEALLSTKLPPKRVRVNNPQQLKRPSETVTHLLAHFHGSTNFERFIDASRLRDRGLADILSIFLEGAEGKAVKAAKARLDEKLETLKKRLTNTKDSQKGSSCSPSNKNIIAKLYTSLEALKEEDGKACWWDLQYDKTNYKLKTEGATQATLEKKLTGMAKFAGLSARELEKEATAVLMGKRRVMEGEHAILQNGVLHKNILFTRRKVDGREVWVKSGTADICNDTIETELLNESTCVFDSFEGACKSLKEAKTAKLIARIKSCIEIVEAAQRGLKDLAEVSQLVKVFGYMRANSAGALRSMPFHGALSAPTPGNEAMADDLEGDIDGPSFDDLVNNIEGQDFNYAPMPINAPKGQKVMGGQDDIVNTISRALDINFSDDHKEYMSHKVSVRYNYNEIDVKVAEEKAKLMSKVNMDLYQSNHEFRKKVDAKVEEKLKASVESNYVGFYYKQTLYGVALVTCMIMALYPTVQVHKIIPKCTSNFSITGFPLSADDPHSLEIYIVNSLRFFAVPEDIRYQQLLDKKEEELKTDVRKLITEILDEDYSISQSIEMNKSNLVLKKRNTRNVDALLRPSFRPNFHFTASPSNNIVAYLSTLNERIRRAKYSKTNIAKSAFISNTCCPEKLSHDIDFYSPVINDDELKAAFKKIRTTDVSRKAKNDVLFLKRAPLNPREVPPYNTIVHKSVEMKAPHMEKEAIEMVVKDDAFFNKVLLPKLSSNYDHVIKILDANVDNIETAKLHYLRDIFVKGLNEDLNNTRNALHSFVKGKIPLLIGRFVTGFKSQVGGTQSFVKACEALESNSDARNALVKTNLAALKEVPFYDGKEDVLVKNIAVIMDTFVNMLKDLLGKASGPASLKVICMVCYSLLDNLYSFVDNTNYDIGAIEKKIENLREKRKETMMGNYMADDDERSLQIQLRNMGVSNWETVFDRIKGVDLNALSNMREEAENFRMADYQGENAEGDIDEDTDFVR